MVNEFGEVVGVIIEYHFAIAVDACFRHYGEHYVVAHDEVVVDPGLPVCDGLGYEALEGWKRFVVSSEPGFKRFDDVLLVDREVVLFGLFVCVFVGREVEHVVDKTA